MARAWSATFDELIGKHLETFFHKHMSMNAPGVLANYPDIFSVLIILILTGKNEKKFLWLIIRCSSAILLFAFAERGNTLIYFGFVFKAFSVCFKCQIDLLSNYSVRAAVATSCCNCFDKNYVLGAAGKMRKELH